MIFLKQVHYIHAEVGHVLGNEIAKVAEVVLLIENDLAGHLFQGPSGVLHSG